jgi:hypothetical protein
MCDIKVRHIDILMEQVSIIEMEEDRKKTGWVASPVI